MRRPLERRPAGAGVALTAAALALAVVAALFVPARTVAAQPPAGARAADVPADVGWVVGGADAPLEVVEFLDLGCSACAQFTADGWPAVERDFVATGRVRWRVVPFVLRRFPHSAWATEVAACAAEQGRFAPVAHALLARRAEWSVPGGDPPHALLRRIAGEAGADTTTLAACTASGRQRERVRRHSEVARSLGVWGTPTFLLPGGRRAFGALPAAVFREVLEQALSAAGERPPPRTTPRAREATAGR